MCINQSFALRRKFFEAILAHIHLHGKPAFIARELSIGIDLCDKIAAAHDV